MNTRQLLNYKTFGRQTLGVLLFLFAIASGAMDAYRALIPKLNQFQYCTQEERFLANWIKKNTSPESTWLTGNYHNNWLFNFTGRQVLLAYPGWLWTHGYHYLGIERDFQAMFNNPGQKELFAKYKIDYILIGPVEMREQMASLSEFKKVYPVVKETDNYTIFTTKKDDPLLRKSKSVPSQGLIDLEALLAAEPGRSTSRTPTRLKPGLVKTIYGGKFFFGKKWKVDKNSSDFNFHYDAAQKKPFPSPCSIIWEGYIQIPLEGTYTFALESDDGSLLYLEGMEVVNNDGVHQTKRVERQVKLSKKAYPIKITYFDSGGGAILNVKWKPPFGVEETLPKRVLFP